MINVSKFSATHKQAGALHSLLAPHKFVDDAVFTTRGNVLGILLEVQGVDYEALTEDILESHAKRIAAAWRSLDEHFRIYQYLIKEDRADIEAARGIASDVVQRTVDSRNSHLKTCGLYTIRIVYVLLYEPASAKLPKGLGTQNLARAMARDRERRRSFLRARADSFVRQVGDLLGLQVVERRKAFQFFRLLINLDPAIAKAESVKSDGRIDYYLPSLPVECRKDGIRIGRADVEVLTMREQPRETFPNLLRGLLKIRANFILCSEFKRSTNEAALAKARITQKHHYWSQWVSDIPALITMIINRGKRDEVIADKSAANDVAGIDEVITRINNGGEYMGEFSFTAVLYGWSGRDALQSAVTDAMRVFGDREGSLVPETYNALNAFLSIIPGNAAFNVRRSWLLSSNYADLSFIYAPASGEQKNRHLGREYLVVLETEDQTPFHFNLHVGDRQGMLILGAPGSGKSVLANLIIDHSQKYSPRTFILDIGGSYRQITRKHGGSYLHMRFDAGQSFRINPFSLENTEENRQFLFSFVKLLLNQGGYPSSASQELELFEAIKGMFVLRREQRTLGNLVQGLPRSMVPYLRAWVAGGQFGTVFDNAEDTLTLTDFQAFDFQGMDELYEPVMEPLLFYILQRFSTVVYDPRISSTPKQLWADEVWKFLANDRVRQYLMSAGLTWRKQNGGIGLITQSVDSLREAGVVDVVNEICPMKLLLANAGANLAEYRRMFSMNEREIEMFTGLAPKRQFLMKTAAESRVLNVSLDPVAFWEYANSPYENERRREAIGRSGEEEGLRILAGVAR